MTQRQNSTISALQRAAEAEPANTDALWAVAIACFRRSERAAGVAVLRRMLALAPDRVDVLTTLGSQLYQRGEIDEAIEVLERALRLDGSHLDLLRSLGWLRLIRHDVEGARALFVRAIEVSPGSDNAYLGWFRTLIATGAGTRELVAAGEALSQAPASAIVRGISHALVSVGRYPEAREYLATALTQKCDTVPPWLLLLRGDVELALGDRHASRKVYEAVWLAHGSDPHVWARYTTYLFRLEEHDTLRALVRRAEVLPVMNTGLQPPWWDGSPIEGQRLLLSAMGGFGDMVQFARFGARLADQGVKVLVECGEPVRELLQTLPGVEQAVAPHDDPVSIDLRAHAFAAGLLAGWTWPMRDALPLFEIPGAQVTQWTRVLSPEPVLHVGIAWRVGWNLPSLADPYTRRSMPAECLRPLLDLPGVAFYNLHVGRDGDEELARLATPLPLRRLSDGFGTFLDTAAAIMALDLVVCVDTAVGHVAGGLGKPCLLMLAYQACWRWGQSGSVSGWYPNCTLFRQPRPGDWTSVINAVRDELEQRVAARAVHHPRYSKEQSASSPQR